METVGQKTQQISDRKAEPASMSFWSRYWPLLGVLALGVVLLFLLADTTLQGDPYEWLRTARTLVETGQTGFQHRNILYSYVLAIPLYLNLDPILFGLIISGLSLLVSAALLYKINLLHSTPVLAGYASLVFVLSYPFLRYASQVFSDIPAIMFIVAMVYFHFRFYRDRKPVNLVLGYLMASFAISMRYASGFFFLAFLYYVWITRRDYRWHLMGVLVAVIPYIPQLIYNIQQLGNPLAISYAAQHPIFGLQFFFQDLGSGHENQLPGYLRYMFFDFRGLFVLLTPLAALGAARAFRVMPRPLAVYLVLYLVSFVVLLPFYSYFSNRYAIPALIPCFVWLPLGINWVSEWLRRRPAIWRWSYLLALVVIAYGMFEISFQIIGSSRDLHQLRARVFEEALGNYVKSGDAVYTLPSVAPFIQRVEGARPKALEAEELTPAMLDKYSDRNVFVVWTPELATSEGGSWRLSIAQVQDRLVQVYETRSDKPRELLLYRVLRLIGASDIIPAEEWYIFQAVPKK